MHDFSHPLAEAVKKARYKMKLTQEQVGELADTNARTISAIENGQSNTRMNILYPLIRVLRIDPNEIFHSERYTSSSTKDQLLLLIEDCTDEEAAALLETSETILKLLRNHKAKIIEEEKSLSPLKSEEAGSASFTTGSFAQ